MVLTGSNTDKMGIWVALKNAFSFQGTKKASYASKVWWFESFTQLWELDSFFQ